MPSFAGPPDRAASSFESALLKSVFGNDRARERGTSILGSPIGAVARAEVTD